MGKTKERRAGSPIGRIRFDIELWAAFRADAAAWFATQAGPIPWNGGHR